MADKQILATPVRISEPIEGEIIPDGPGFLTSCVTVQADGRMTVPIWFPSEDREIVADFQTVIISGSQIKVRIPDGESEEITDGA